MMSPEGCVRRYVLERSSRDDYKVYLNAYVKEIAGRKVIRNSPEVKDIISKMKEYLRQISICNERMECLYRRLVSSVGMARAAKMLQR